MADEYTPGAVVFGGRYRLERVLGTGGMAIVWCATDLRLGRRVAIKVIADTLAADPGYVERFAREARTAAGLSHRSLVSVYDYAAAATRPFLVMELVEGGTLADRIKRGPLAPEAVRPLAADLLSALECVHDAGILHRDIKPANVLVGEDGRARLTDFGIAHPEDATRLTQTGQLIGTLRYLAPEVIAGAAPSRQSDLYALGMLLRELSGESEGEGAKGALRALVERLTAPDPAARPASAAQALAELDPTTPTTPTATQPIPPPAAPPAPAAAGPPPPAPSRVRPARPFELRLTPAMVIAGAVGLMVLVLAVLALSGGDPERSATNATSTTGATAATTTAPAITLDERFDQLDALIDAAGR